MVLGSHLLKNVRRELELWCKGYYNLDGIYQQLAGFQKIDTLIVSFKVYKSCCPLSLVLEHLAFMRGVLFYLDKERPVSVILVDLIPGCCPGNTYRSFYMKVNLLAVAGAAVCLCAKSANLLVAHKFS